MKPTRRFLPLAGLLAMAGLLVAGPREASAQIPVYSTERVFAPTGPVMTSRLRRRHARPRRHDRTDLRRAGPPGLPDRRRYFTLRPNDYGGRPQLSFAPYSDAYPKTAPRSIRPIIRSIPADGRLAPAHQGLQARLATDGRRGDDPVPDASGVPPGPGPGARPLPRESGPRPGRDPDPGQPLVLVGPLPRPGHQ